MYCSKCGKQIDDSSRFCSVCGTQFVFETENQSTSVSPESTKETASIKKEKKPHNRKVVKLITFITGGILLVTALVLAVIFLLIPLLKKNKADALMEAENYSEAYYIYCSINNFPNVTEERNECQQKIFDRLIEENKYEDAYNFYYYEAWEMELLKSSDNFKIMMENHLAKVEFDHAQELEKQGAYMGASSLYIDLAEKGFYIEYAEHAEELRNRYKREQAVYWAVGNLKKTLKDPSSLTLYKISTNVKSQKRNNEVEYVYEVTLDYGARNSFGGMVRDDYVSTWWGASEDQVGIINYHDSLIFKTQEQWDEEALGDFKEYHSNFVESISTNIWNQMK